jgi:hypothetical protein
MRLRPYPFSMRRLKIRWREPVVLKSLVGKGNWGRKLISIRMLVCRMFWLKR